MVHAPTPVPQEEFPPLDERLVTPEERYEMVDGELCYVPPADGPHAERHLQVGVLLAAHLKPEFNVSIDMLTRSSRTSDFAPDASVYLRALDPVTGTRQLLRLAFEVASTSTLSRLAVKARILTTRGVHRIFAIDVEPQEVLEWSAQEDKWRALAPDGVIDDVSFAVPIRVADLAHAIMVDDAMARALRLKGNAEITAEREAGKAEGKAEDVIKLLVMRGLLVEASARTRILGERDLLVLERWFVISMTCAEVAELFALRAPAAPAPEQ